MAASSGVTGDGISATGAESALAGGVPGDVGDGGVAASSSGSGHSSC